MTISALNQAADSDRLQRTLELYRDLSVALSGQIALVKAGTGSDVKEPSDALKAHQRVLLSVLEAEASLVKRSRASADGAGVELDLDAARAEILARLAVRSAEA